MKHDPAARVAWADYPLCECTEPYAVWIADKRGPFKGIALGGRRLCHVCNGRVTLAKSLGATGLHEPATPRGAS